jgi:D-alanine-D-alanine ligase
MKTRVGVLFGGKSAEHEVSLQSAKNVIDALDPQRYEIVLIGIDKRGRWHLHADARRLLPPGGPAALESPRPDAAQVVLLPGEDRTEIVDCSSARSLGSVDVVFPVLHGPFGEDGTVQGLLKLADIPFVGAGVLGSAVGMDKDAMKRLLTQAGIPNARAVVLRAARRPRLDAAAVAAELGLPLFVKPANLGSSVGITKVKTADALAAAVDLAFEYDRKVIVEECVTGRELECSVLGNEEPVASLPGEVVPRDEWYSYEAKYLDENGAALLIPAELDRATTARVQGMAVEAFTALCCEGMARVDFFLRPDGRLYVNEINTIPGFTRISMYPKLWEASGVAYGELLDRLIALALERSRTERALRTSYRE